LSNQSEPVANKAVQRLLPRGQTSQRARTPVLHCGAGDPARGAPAGSNQGSELSLSGRLGDPALLPVRTRCKQGRRRTSSGEKPANGRGRPFYIVARATPPAVGPGGAESGKRIEPNRPARRSGPTSPNPLRKRPSDDFFPEEKLANGRGERLGGRDIKDEALGLEFGHFSPRNQC
jgi:hypothetical protein